MRPGRRIPESQFRSERGACHHPLSFIVHPPVEFERLRRAETLLSLLLSLSSSSSASSLSFIIPISPAHPQYPYRYHYYLTFILLSCSRSHLSTDWSGSSTRCIYIHTHTPHLTLHPYIHPYIHTYIYMSTSAPRLYSSRYRHQYCAYQHIHIHAPSHHTSYELLLLEAIRIAAAYTTRDLHPYLHTSIPPYLLFPSQLRCLTHRRLPCLARRLLFIRQKPLAPTRPITDTNAPASPGAGAQHRPQASTRSLVTG